RPVFLGTLGLIGMVWLVFFLHILNQTNDRQRVIAFGGGCAPFQVFAQNRWLPYGAAIRPSPNPLSKQISTVDANRSIAVDGWVHGTSAYPANPTPFNGDAWFHLADRSGWVSFA